MSRLIDAISDFCSSDQFLFLDPMLKPYAEQLLSHWCGNVGSQVTISSADDSLKKTAGLDLPVEVKKMVPNLVREYLGFLGSSGRIPQAGQWADLVATLEPEYLGRFRDDGSVRGETFKKKYSDTGRNDPCPCGSGRKFKQCCKKLIG